MKNISLFLLMSFFNLPNVFAADPDPIRESLSHTRWSTPDAADYYSLSLFPGRREPNPGGSTIKKEPEFNLIQTSSKGIIETLAGTWSLRLKKGSGGKTELVLEVTKKNGAPTKKEIIIAELKMNQGIIEFLDEMHTYIRLSPSADVPVFLGDISALDRTSWETVTPIDSTDSTKFKRRLSFFTKPSDLSSLYWMLTHKETLPNRGEEVAVVARGKVLGVFGDQVILENKHGKELLIYRMEYQVKDGVVQAVLQPVISPYAAPLSATDTFPSLYLREDGTMWQNTVFQFRRLGKHWSLIISPTRSWRIEQTSRQEDPQLAKDSPLAAGDNFSVEVAIDTLPSKKAPPKGGFLKLLNSSNPSPKKPPFIFNWTLGPGGAITLSPFSENAEKLFPKNISFQLIGRARTAREEIGAPGSIGNPCRIGLTTMSRKKSKK